MDDRQVEQYGLDLDDPDQVLWREWPITEGYVTNDSGQVACRIFKKLPARRLWDMIMASTYDFAEPGFVLVDRVNEMNNNWFDENIRATNPCGEQPLPPYGSCLLGSVNLTKFVQEPFAENARFDWDEFHRVVKVFTRMLDNVVEINGLPLPRQREEILRKRRHGMGFLGLGSTLTMLRMRYGSKESVKFTDDVSREMALAGWETALDLAREKGPAPILLEDFTVTADMLRKRPRWRAMAGKLATGFPGAFCTHATAATCSGWPRLLRNWSRTWSGWVRGLPTTVRLHRPARFHCPWPTMPAMASSRVLPTTTSAM